MPITQFRMNRWIPDTKPHELPDDAWSDIDDMSASQLGGYIRRGGDNDLGTETPDVAYLFNFLQRDEAGVNELDNFWIYGGEVSGTSKVYLKEGDSGVDTDITGSSGTALANSSIADDWTGGIINGFPVLTVDAIKHGAGASNMKYWPATFTGSGPAAPDALVELPGQRSNYRAAWLRAHRFHLFAGHTISTANNHQPDELLWSDAAAVGAVPSTWSPSASNEAGDVRLSDSPGPLVDGLSWGEQFLIFKHHAVYAARYVGGNAVFSFRKLVDGIGVIGRHCAQAVGGTVYLFTPDDIVAFDGYRWQSIAEGKVRNRIFDSVYGSSVNSYAAFLAYKPDTKELVCGIPNTSATCSITPSPASGGTVSCQRWAWAVMAGMAPKGTSWTQISPASTCTSAQSPASRSTSWMSAPPGQRVRRLPGMRTAMTSTLATASAARSSNGCGPG